jgi:myo-inositol-1-phosphate synthase
VGSRRTYVRGKGDPGTCRQAWRADAGDGAVATTLVAGVELIRKGYAAPIGSLTQLGTISLGKRTEDRVPKTKDFAPLQGLDGLVFGG